MAAICVKHQALQVGTPAKMDVMSMRARHCSSVGYPFGHGGMLSNNKSIHRNTLCTRSLQRRMLLVASAEKMRVALTGAGGRTGSIVAEKLLSRASDIDTRVIISSGGSKKKLSDLGYKDNQILGLDITEGTDKLERAFNGCDVVILLTSAVPRMRLRSLPGVLWGKLRGERKMPQFKWKQNQPPEMVDWIGGKNQIDAANAAGVKRVIWIGSMGGTDPEHNLNKLGDANILQWKRKAEEYLINSGLKYTIIHPGGLKDDPAGERRIVLDVDDQLIKRESRSIPRGDVAEICIQCLELPEAANRAFDVISEDGEHNLDMKILLQEMKENDDYTINSQLSLSNEQ